MVLGGICIVQNVQKLVVQRVQFTVNYIKRIALFPAFVSGGRRRPGDYCHMCQIFCLFSVKLTVYSKAWKYGGCVRIEYADMHIVYS